MLEIKRAIKSYMHEEKPNPRSDVDNATRDVVLPINVYQCSSGIGFIHAQYCQIEK